MNYVQYKMQSPNLAHNNSTIAYRVFEYPDLSKMHTYLSCTLYGGIGNMFFQIASILAAAKHHNKMAIFTNWAIPAENFFLHHNAFGGHDVKKKLNDIFPRLNYCDNLVVVPLVDFTRLHDNEFRPLSTIIAPVIASWFWDYRYFHHERAYILEQLQFALSTIEKTRAMVPNLEKCVSVHIRGMSKGDGMVIKKMDPMWFAKVVNTLFTHETSFLFICINEPECAEYANIVTSMNKRVIIISADEAECLCMMSQCKAHILSNSSFAFMGAYLNPNQPCTTIFDSQFELAYSNKWIPSEWRGIWRMIE